MTVTINGITPIQPNTLLEDGVDIQSDQEAIDGTMSRNRLGRKKRAMLTWQNISPAEYQAIAAVFTTGSGVAYNNDQSKVVGGVLTFTGFSNFQEGPYVPGTSLYSSLTATIREI